MADSRSEQFFSVTQVAKMLACSRVTVWRSITKGHLPAVRIGHCWRIPARALGNKVMSTYPSEPDGKNLRKCAGRWQRAPGRPALLVAAADLSTRRTRPSHRARRPHRER